MARTTKETTKVTTKTEVAKEIKPMIIPRATEKAYTQQSAHTYVFQVPASFSKQAIAEAVKETFQVKEIKGVRTLTRKGKSTRFSRGKRAYPGTTYRQDHKLAYVTVGENDKIPVFEEEAKKEEEKK